MINSLSAEAINEPWRPHPELARISYDDPELAVILRGITRPVIPMGEVVKDGPFGRTAAYQHAAPYDEGIDSDSPNSAAELRGLLKTWVACGRRFSYALDFARYLLVLKRIGDAAQPKARLSERQ